MQLDLFDEENESATLKKQVQLLQKEMHKMNRNNKLQLQQVMKMYIELKEDLERLGTQLSHLKKELPNIPQTNSNSDLLEKLFAKPYET